MNFKKNWITKTGVFLGLSILAIFTAVAPAQSRPMPH